MKGLEHLKKYRVILASGSPRRQYLLSQLGISFDVFPSLNHDEQFLSHLTKDEIPVFLAEEKARQMEHLLDDNTLLITADTIVWLDNQVINKPADEEDARRMLGQLSGRTHEVVTGVCILSRKKKCVFHENSWVTFAPLSQEEIHYYVENYKPLDKAGAYGIQDWIGYIGIERIEGSFYNVMGLPIQRLYQELKKF
jgi:septum formation protein